jgi:hypothetical protein
VLRNACTLLQLWYNPHGIEINRIVSVYRLHWARLCHLGVCDATGLDDDDDYGNQVGKQSSGGTLMTYQQALQKAQRVGLNFCLLHSFVAASLSARSPVFLSALVCNKGKWL